MCAVSWRSWAIDSRDGEVDQLLINGHAVWRQKAQMAFTVQTNGNACARGWLQGPRDFPNPWHGTNAPACYVDRTVAVSCKPNSIMKVTFMSGVDEQKNNEAWAFSDFSVHVRPRPTRPPPPPAQDQHHQLQVHHQELSPKDHLHVQYLLQRERHQMLKRHANHLPGKLRQGDLPFEPSVPHLHQKAARNAKHNEHCHVAMLPRRGPCKQGRLWLHKS